MVATRSRTGRKIKYTRVKILETSKPKRRRRMNVVENPASVQTNNIKRPYRKKSIPAAVRQQVWLTYVGEQFKSKCKVKWCRNTITVFQFDCGHNVPESKGGSTTIDNLLPICSNCNGSMRENYTIDEWNATFAPKKKNFLGMCFGKSTTVDSAAVAPQK